MRRKLTRNCTIEKTKPAQSVNGLTKKTEALKVDSPTPSKQQKVNSKGLDVPKLWAEEASKRKSTAAFVVIGHVDHGKSTLMGRLLLDTGAVSQRDIEKYKKQAAEMGKASFALAWVMDTGKVILSASDASIKSGLTLSRFRGTRTRRDS